MVKKYLNWVEYKTLLFQKDKFGFMHETARESINNLKDYFIFKKVKNFLSYFYINSLPLNNKNNRAGLKHRSLKK